MVRKIEFERKLGPKGQVVIPKELRKFLGVYPGSEILFTIKDEDVVLKPKKFDVEEFFNLVPPEKRRKITLKEVKKGYEEELEERWRRVSHAVSRRKRLHLR